MPVSTPRPSPLSRLVGPAALRRRGLLLTLALACSPCFVRAAPAVSIAIRTVREEMRFDVREFHVPVGERVRLTFKNDDGLPHNLLICLPREVCAPGATEDNGLEVAQAAWALGGEGPERQWIPQHPRVFASTNMLEQGRQQTLEFDAPTRPGRYPFLCTFPGHAAMMWGTMHVQTRVDGLKDLRYRILRCGPRLTYPDFDSLRGDVLAEGALPDGLLRADPVTVSEAYAAEFTASLEIPLAGDYTFVLAGDRGTQLFIDGRLAVDHQAGHSARALKSGKISLAAGTRRILLRYWHPLGDDPEVSLVWSGPGFDERALSRINLVERKRQNDGDRLLGMQLHPESGEPVLYRNALADTPKGGFALGFPSGASLSWDPQNAGPVTFWAGDFLDVTSHRTSRGAGVVKPAGFSVVRPFQGPTFLVVTDTTTPRPALVRRLGLHLDRSRTPHFRSRVEEVEVEEYFSTRGEITRDTLVLERHLTFLTPSGTPPGLVVRLASRPHLTLTAGEVILDGKLGLRLVGAVADLRPVHGQDELLVPVAFQNRKASFVVEYRWLSTAAQAHAAAVHAHASP
ncbi:MAG: plastocyanin/azurin family copper-binding protein [Opitutaceae bacterium]